ncbi:hypothetical protein HG535_0A04230 [Zygotorulaspora mrakii]|uniref:Protein BFR2 n=1 Tax=Zygotorulaspora mrakii TaxID=42260 RepID=A0A7H9AW89_ZYGMR|nr:uncharacterized protein HG535_0A04230 [Zygotorulaspora mrakii]QLG70483.1 hypothetical protein HG535_0A04230 [Zygotorulaspora mrakii]
MGNLLADQIIEISNRPVNADYDIEDNDVGVFEHRDDRSSGDESDGSADDAGSKNQKDHYVSVGNSKLRDDGMELDGGKYHGAKGSRHELFDDGLEEGIPTEEESAQESDAVSWRTDSEDEADSDRESSSGEEVEAEQDEEVEEESEVKRDRLAEMVEQETRKAVKKLSETTQRDAAKGLCIIEQSQLFDSILDVRMKLQKGIAAANNLPLSENSWSYYESQSPETEKLLKKTSKLLEKLLGQMVDFRKEFQINDNISPSSEEKHGKSQKKRSISQLTKDTAGLDDELMEYRSAVLNKWSTKVNAASGKSALNSSKFKAINQPSDVQVENQLSDMDRLIKRTCLSRRNTRPLRFQEDLKCGRLSLLEPPEDKEDSKNDPGEDIDIPKNYDPRRKDDTSIDTSENPYIFDDEDFYRVLLNDLVDKKILNAKNSQGSSATIAITSRSNNKLKKNIDTKASKGRKLNYSIQEAIANFEAPRDLGYKWSDEQIDEFFAGLLGQKVSFDEVEDHSGNENEDAQESSAFKNDDIQIFG